MPMADTSLNTLQLWDYSYNNCNRVLEFCYMLNKLFYILKLFWISQQNYCHARNMNIFLRSLILFPNSLVQEEY